MNSGNMQNKSFIDKIAQPTVVSQSGQKLFEKQAIKMGLDPENLWVGGYVDYEWQHLRLILAGYQLNPKGLKVLEFGSNIGASAIVFHHLGAEVLGIDVLEDYIELSKLNALRFAKPDIEFLYLADTRKLPIADNTFDLINLNSVLEYIKDTDLKTVQLELDRVLKPGGKILVTGTSSRLWPKEVHSEKWLVNYLPKKLDRLLGLPATTERGVSPWKVRYGFGKHYQSLDQKDKGQGYLRSRQLMSPNKTFFYKSLVTLAKILNISPGLLTNNISCLLKKHESN